MKRIFLISLLFFINIQIFSQTPQWYENQITTSDPFFLREICFVNVDISRPCWCLSEASPTR